MQYETVAAAYRDLEQVSSRLALIDRLAELLRQTPDPLLPRVVYLCLGDIAPAFTGIEIGLADKMVTRALADGTGVPLEEVRVTLRETGDLGLTAEQLLAAHGAAQRASTLDVGAVFETLHQIAAAAGAGSQGRKLELLGGLLELATPLEARYLARTVTGSLRLGVGHPTVLDALALVHTGSRASRPVLERAYNICSDLGLVAATLVHGGLEEVEAIQVRPGNPVRPMLAQRMSSAAELLAKLGGSCGAEYKYDGVRVQAHRTADGRVELFTRRLERVAGQFPDVVELLEGGLGPRQVILEGEVVAADPVSGELRPFQEVMHRRRKHGIAEAIDSWPVSLYCFDLLYADGEDLTRLPYRQRRARLERAVTPSPRLRLATAAEFDDAEPLELFFEQAVADGCEGLICKSVAPEAGYQAGARGWLWIKLKRDYRSELSDTLDLVVVGALAGRGRRAGMYGALLLAAYDAEADMFRTVCKCGTGFSDAELATLPERLASLVRPDRPARVDTRMLPDVWFEPALVAEVLGAELTLSPTHTAAWGLVKEDAGLALRFPRFTGRWRDDKSPEDATTVAEVVDLYRTARPTRPVPDRPAPRHERFGMQRAYGLEIPQTLEEVCDPRRMALLVYDMQVGIVRHLPDAGAFTARVVRVVEAARRAGARVVFARHLSLPNELAGVFQLRTAMAWQRVDRVEEVRPLFLRDAPDFQLVPELAPLPSEAVFDKLAMSMFVGTPLELVLRDCGVNAFAIVGAVTEIGIEPTVRHGADLGFIPVVVADACGSVDPAAGERSLAGLDYALMSLQTDVETFTGLLDRSG